MSVVVHINGVDYTSKLVEPPVIHKGDVLHGRITANDCQFTLDNTDLAWKITDMEIEGQAVEVWIDSTKQFTGVATKPSLSRNQRRITIHATDGMKRLRKLKCADKMYINTAVDDILTWLVEDIAGIATEDHNLDSIKVISGVGTTQAIVGYALYEASDRLMDRLQEIVDSCHGSMWFDEEGTLQFRSGFAATWSTDTVGTVTVSKLSDIDGMKWLESVGERIIVRSRNRKVKPEKEAIFTWSGTVEPEGKPTGKDEEGNPVDEKWKALFDHPSIEVDDYATVDANKDFDSGLSLNETVYNDNFDGGQLKYPKHMYLQIDNSTGYQKTVRKLLINGKPVLDNELTVIYPAESFEHEKEINNDLISSRVWASSLAKFVYEEGNGKFQVPIRMADYEQALDWKIGDKMEIVESTLGLSHRAVIHSIDIDTETKTVNLTVRSDRDSAFVYEGGDGDSGDSSNKPDVPTIGDGLPPAVPTGLSVNSFYQHGKAYIYATWDPNTEEDLKGYELRWSYDDTNWNHAGSTTSEEMVVEVTHTGTTDVTYTIYIQVRATDLEGFKSNWSASDSTSVEKRTTPPDRPSSVIATSGVGLIYVNWSKVNDRDLSAYILERRAKTSSGGSWGSWSVIAALIGTDYVDENVDYHIFGSEYEDDPDYPQYREYQYRVKTVDHTGNESTEYRESGTAHAYQATGDDIRVKSITANHLTVTLDLAVGRRITVGDNIKLGTGIFAGEHPDGLYVGTSEVADDISFVMNNSTTVTSGRGQRIKPLVSFGTLRLRIAAGNTGYTQCVLGVSGELLETIDVSGVSAGSTFEINYPFEVGTNYYVCLDAGGSEATYRYVFDSATHSTDEIEIAQGAMYSGGNFYDTSTTKNAFDEVTPILGTKYLKFDMDTFELKTDFILGAGDNSIVFENADIKLRDIAVEYEDDTVRKMIRFDRGNGNSLFQLRSTYDPDFTRAGIMLLTEPHGSSAPSRIELSVSDEGNNGSQGNWQVGLRNASGIRKFISINAMLDTSGEPYFLIIGDVSIVGDLEVSGNIT